MADMNQPLPFADGSLSCITCIEGIEHLERPFDFVRECERVLRDDGCLILTTPNTSSIRSRWRFFLTGFHNKCKYMLDETAPNPLHHIGMLSFPALRYMLHTNGFEIQKIEYPMSFWLVSETSVVSGAKFSVHLPYVRDPKA